VIRPGSTIGVLGGGQLGRMFAMAARRLGYRVHTLAPEHDTPTGQIADVEVEASYDDLDRIRAFARGVDVVTFEFENVPAAAAAAAEEHAIVRPNGRALEIAQHRVREKTFLTRHGLPVTPFVQVQSAGDLAEAVRRLGRPAVLKTAALGYDGKGQMRITGDDDLAEAWHALGAREAILEAWVDLECELSVIGARAVDGSSVCFGPIDNAHQHHILDVSFAPAHVTAQIAAEAIEATRTVMEALEYVGILCIEFFLTRDGHLLLNELAPRPHNSGHLTFDACRTSQFEQQVRAICELPLGSPELLQPAAMANLLGDLWAAGEPNWGAALSLPDVKLHLYGKATPRPGRKMGHLTVLASTPEAAKLRVLEARAALMRGN
jgi:5-(carboxyamino)imidazole ribonucleotide synthase